jgi:hypothetical protein
MLLTRLQELKPTTAEEEFQKPDRRQKRPGKRFPHPIAMPINTIAIILNGPMSVYGFIKQRGPTTAKRRRGFSQSAVILKQKETPP